MSATLTPAVRKGDTRSDRSKADPIRTDPYHPALKFRDLSNEPLLEPVQSMVRAVGAAQSSHEALTAFIAGYGRYRPIQQFVGVVPEPGVPDGFRVIYDVSTLAVTRGTETHTRDLSASHIASRPLHTGGVIADLIRLPTPKLASDVDFSGEPALSSNARAMRACMAIPIFSGERIQEWSLALAEAGEALEPRDVVQGTLVGNLLSIGNSRIDAMTEVSRLLNALRNQIDQIARLQQALLPDRLPDHPGLELATSYLASEIAGGDYYDFLPLPGNRLGILIADVSGHGAAAATIVAMLHAILHCYAPPPGTAFNPGLCLAFVNKRLYASGLEGQFVTAFLGVLDPATGSFTYANAGHPPPRLKRGSDGQVQCLQGSVGLPLAVVDSAETETTTVQLEPLDTVVMYTDGVTEAFDQHRTMFGTERLDDSLERCSGAPDCAVDSIHKGLFRHRGSSTRDDDQTLVIFRYHGVCQIPSLNVLRSR